MAAAEIQDLQENEQSHEAIVKAQRESVNLYDQVKELTVTDQGSHDLMVDLYKAAAAMEKSLNEAHGPVCDFWYRKWKRATDDRKNDLDKVVEAKKLAKQKYDSWEMEQKRLDEERERKIQEEARRKAEEAARIAREAAEAERKRLEAQEQEDRLRLAEQAKSEGANDEEVNAILDTPLPIPEPVIAIPEPEPVVLPTVAPSFAKASGVAARWNYSAVCTDLSALVKAAAANPFFLQYIEPNVKAINGLAKTSKDAFQLAGCSLKKERV